MRLLAIALVAGLSLTGCAVTSQSYNINASYDAAAHTIKDGNNIVQGNALLRTMIGEVRTCAGYEAQITAVTPYSTERITAIYGNANKGYRNAYQGGIDFVPANPHYDNEAGRRTTCDSAGNFEFRNIADGEYYVITQVMWQVPGQYIASTEGGVLMHRVVVSGGETKRVVLTN